MGGNFGVPGMSDQVYSLKDQQPSDHVLVVEKMKTSGFDVELVGEILVVKCQKEEVEVA